MTRPDPPDCDHDLDADGADLAHRHGWRARPRGGADPRAQEFIEALKSSGLGFLVLTNNSIFTPRDLRARLLGSGIDVPEAAIWTSALATAQFLADQRPDGTAYVWGRRA